MDFSTLVSEWLRWDSKTCGENNPSHMEKHTIIDPLWGILQSVTALFHSSKRSSEMMSQLPRLPRLFAQIFYINQFSTRVERMTFHTLLGALHTIHLNDNNDYFITSTTSRHNAPLSMEMCISAQSRMCRKCRLIDLSNFFRRLKTAARKMPVTYGFEFIPWTMAMWDKATVIILEGSKVVPPFPALQR